MIVIIVYTYDIPAGPRAADVDGSLHDGRV